MLVEFPKQNASTPVTLTRWYEKKGWQVVGGALLVLLAVWTARVGVQEKGQLKEFFKLNAEVAKLRKGEAIDQQELSKMIKAHPEIKPLLAPVLMQNHQLAGEAKEATTIAEESLKRLGYIDPLYLQFAEASLLIEKGDFKKALAISLDLNGRCEGCPVLHELNLKRIDFLSK